MAVERRATTVSVSARACADGVVVSVADQGPGIPAADLPRVFEKFYRSRHVGESEGGTGLGLAIVQRIVDDHGGEVSIDSEPGKGTTVSFFLPIGPAG